LLLGLSYCGGTVGVGDPTGTATEAVTSLTISGRVTDGSGFPVSSVKISLNGSAQASVFTDFNGNYKFSVNPGSYSLTPSGSCASFEPSVVNLNNLTASTTVNFLGAGGEVCSPLVSSGGTSGSLTVSGHVTSAGHAVPGVKVTLNGSAQGFRITDQAGAYSFLANPGSYSLTPSGACNSFTPTVANLNGLTTGRTQDFSGSGNCPPAPLTFCPFFDEQFIGTDGGPPSCVDITTPSCPDRVDTWDVAIVLDYATAISNDCRFGQWSTGLLSPTDVANYLNDLLQWTLAVMGCPLQGFQTGPLAFDLIPAALSSRTFTTADLGALSATYVAAVNQALSDNGSPALTPAQQSALNAQLAYLAANVHGTVNSPNFTFSTCDAGAP
jgi:hypothetical protein